MSRKEWLYWFVVLSASLNFALSYTRLLYPPFSYSDYAHGLVPYPYQSRLLMSRVFALFEHNRVLEMARMHVREPLVFPFRILILIVAFVSVVIAVWFVRLALESLIEDKGWARWASLLVVYMAYFHYILDADSPYMYPYDLPSLAIFSAGLYLILKRRWVWYYLVFILGTFNRETACFLTVFLLVFELAGNRRLAKIALHVAAQAILWVAIRHYCTHFYPGVHNGTYWALGYNLRHGLVPKHWPGMTTAFGFLWIVYLLGFRQIPSKALRWCAVILVLWAVAMLTFGWIYEMRVYGELIPYMAVCVALIAYRHCHPQNTVTL